VSQRIEDRSDAHVAPFTMHEWRVFDTRGCVSCSCVLCSDSFGVVCVGLMRGNTSHGGPLGVWTVWQYLSWRPLGMWTTTVLLACDVCCVFSRPLLLYACCHDGHAFKAEEPGLY